MNKPTINIRLATLDDTQKLYHLRHSSFSETEEFKLINADYLKIQRGSVYVAEYNSKLISTIQFEVVEKISDLIEKSGTNIIEDREILNTIYLSKGATERKFRNTGINSIIRLFALNEALRNATINSITGIGYENAPRLNLLKHMGYDLIEASSFDYDFIVPNGKVHFLYLNKQYFKQAITLLEKMMRDLENTHNLVFSSPI